MTLPSSFTFRTRDLPEDHTWSPRSREALNSRRLLLIQRQSTRCRKNSWLIYTALQLQVALGYTRQSTKIKKKTRNKSNDYFESMQYRQDVRHIAHYRKRKHFPSYTRCSEYHNNTSAENRKIRGLKFDTLYWRHLAAYRKNEYRCTTTYHPL